MKDWWQFCIFAMLGVLTWTLIEIFLVLDKTYDEEHRAIRLVEIITIDRKDDGDQLADVACPLAAVADGIGGYEVMQMCRR